MRALLAIVLLASLVAGSAAAQQSRYSRDFRAAPDTAPAAGETDLDALQRLVEELTRLIDEADRARAADPTFLRDLRSVVQRYSWPWRTVVLFDDFADGNITENPAWTTVGGGFTADAFAGLRTRLVAAAPPPPQQRRRQSGDDVALQIFGQILQQATRPNPDQRQPQGERAQRPAPPSEAVMRTAVAVPDAYAWRLELAAQPGAAARIEFGVTQGAGDLGYRLAINFDSAPALELLRVGRRGASVIDASREALTLADGAAHLVQFTRSVDGEMAVSVDGTEQFRIADRSFRDAFDGVVLINRGGEYTTRSIAVLGAS